MEVEDFINNNRTFFFVFFLSFRRCFRIIATKRLVASLSLSSGTAGIIVVILLLNAVIAGKPLEPKQILKKNLNNFFLFFKIRSKRTNLNGRSTDGSYILFVCITTCYDLRVHYARLNTLLTTYV